MALGRASILGGRASFLGTIAGAVLFVTVTAPINASEGWRSVILGCLIHAAVVGTRPVPLTGSKRGEVRRIRDVG